MTTKDEIIIVGCPEPTGREGEYKKTCFKCKKTVYLADDWKDKPTAKFACTECILSKKLKVNPDDIDVDMRTANNLEKDFGHTPSPLFLKNMAKRKLALTK